MLNFVRILGKNSQKIQKIYTKRTKMKLIKNKANFAWCLVILGGIVEIFWVSGLKHADTPLTHALTLAGIAFSFASMLLAVRYIEVSVAYAVFVGIGALGVVLSDALVFGETFSALKLVLIGTLFVGIIGLKLQSRHQAHLSDEAFAQKLGNDLGVGELDKRLFEGGER